MHNTEDNSRYTQKDDNQKKRFIFLPHLRDRRAAVEWQPNIKSFLRPDLRRIRVTSLLIAVPVWTNYTGVKGYLRKK